MSHTARQERQGVSGGRGGGKHKVWIHDEWASAPAALSTGSWGCCDQGFGECKGSYWMIFELESRDFMHYMARKHGASLFVYPAAITASEQQLEQLDAVVRHRLRLWKEGRTGVNICTQFTCFSGSNAQILTQKALHRRATYRCMHERAVTNWLPFEPRPHASCQLPLL